MGLAIDVCPEAYDEIQDKYTHTKVYVEHIYYMSNISPCPVTINHEIGTARLASTAFPRGTEEAPVNPGLCRHIDNKHY